MGCERRTAVGWITAIAVSVSVASYLLSLPIGILDMIVSPDLGANLASLSGTLAIEAFLLIFETPLQINALAIIIGSIAIFCICFAKAATANSGFQSGIRTLLTGSRPRTLPNWLAVMPLLASSLFVIVELLYLIQLSVGIPTGNLACPAGTMNCQAILFTGIVTAPVAEEFGFRISVLGLAVAILVWRGIRRQRDRGSEVTTRQAFRTILASFVSPGYAKERSGLPSVRTSGLKGISIPEWIFLFITSAIFGAYHVLGGGGWGPGKFVTAALSGIALGLVYLAYGAFADILLHWFFNFYFEVFAIMTPFSGVFTPLGNLNALGCLALGVWGIILTIKWLTQKRPGSAMPAAIPTTLP